MLYPYLKGGDAVFTRSGPNSLTLVAPIRSLRNSSVYTGLLSVIISNMKLGTVPQTLAAQQAALQCSHRSEQGIKYQLLPISVPDKAPKTGNQSIHAFALEDGGEMNHSNTCKNFFFFFFLIISLTRPFLPERLE